MTSSRAEAGRLLVVTQHDVDRAFQRSPPETRGPWPARRRRNPSCRRRRDHRAGPSTSRKAKGSLDQTLALDGTTSVWPDRTTPPSTRGPIVARIAALSPEAFGARRAATPSAAQIIFDEGDERQVRPVADAVESDEARQQRLGLREPVCAHREGLLTRFRAGRGEEIDKMWTRRRPALKCRPNVQGASRIRSKSPSSRASSRTARIRTTGRYFWRYDDRDRQSRRQAGHADRAPLAHHRRGRTPAGGARPRRGRGAADHRAGRSLPLRLGMPAPDSERDDGRGIPHGRARTGKASTSPFPPSRSIRRTAGGC